MGQSRWFVPVRSRPNDQTVPILVSTGNATDRPAPRRRVSRRRVVAHSAGTGWRANDPTYRRGTVCSLPVSRAMISACLASGQLHKNRADFLRWRWFSRSGDCLRWGRGGTPMRRAECRQPFNTGHDVRSHSTNAASSSSKEACDGVPCETRRGPRRTVTTTTRHAHSDGIGGKIGSDR